MEYKYLSHLTRDGFMEVKDTYDMSCYYRMYDVNNNTAKFEFYGNAKLAIIKWSAVLDPVAEYRGNLDYSQEIRMISPGTLRYNSKTGCWEVTQKVTLELI